MCLIHPAAFLGAINHTETEKMAGENNKVMLEEAMKPHLATDEGQKFLAGQANLDEIRVRLFSLFKISSARFFVPFFGCCHPAHQLIFSPSSTSPAWSWRIHRPPNISRNCSSSSCGRKSPRQICKQSCKPSSLPTHACRI